MIENAALMRAAGGDRRDERSRPAAGNDEQESTPSGEENAREENARLERRLRREMAEHETTRRKLAATERALAALRRDVERRVGQRTQELGAAVQRYDTALRGSHISIFTQDRELRYTSVGKSLFGRDSGDILGRTDDEILPRASADMLTAVKREVLARGQAADAEVRVESDAGECWYDLHIEPLRDVGGGIVGLTCAAVEITARKQDEEHLRLLMRELTHRSKNLLAVVQAMARQTAGQGGTIANFLERFGARLQALSRAHDLLVRESWHGASLHELIRAQLGHYLDRDNPQISIAGPETHLRPEAAQSLGLALHELATNAAKHGALSRARGRVAVEWRLNRDERGGRLEIVWKESKGPKVGAPRRRGFGSMVIEHNLTRALDAEVELDFSPEGLRCRIAVPASHFSAGSGGNVSAARGVDAATGRDRRNMLTGPSKA